MPDVVVTVPKKTWLDWIGEGDPAGTPSTGEEWGFYLGGGSPAIAPGERVYVVAHGLLRGYAPLTRLAWVYPSSGREAPQGYGNPVLCRRGGAVAVTIPTPIQGFRGWRYRDWDRGIEVPFPEWRTKGVPVPSSRSGKLDEYTRLTLLDCGDRGRHV